MPPALWKEENEQVIEQFLAGSPQMYKEDATAFARSAIHLLMKGDFAPLPLDGCDGFLPVGCVVTCSVSRSVYIC